MVSSTLRRSGVPAWKRWGIRFFFLLVLSLIPTFADGPLPSDSRAPSQRLIEAARAQIGVTVHYDGRYTQLTYPGGDLPLDRGVCTDVVIRAYRALGIDLQQLVHEDMTGAFANYPQLWGLSRPDPNIDHRRVPNLVVFFQRKGETRPVGFDAGFYRPGDLVTWRLPGNLPHIGIISDRQSVSGRPLILHNIGAGAAEEDILFSYPITGHFRYFPDQVLTMYPTKRGKGVGERHPPEWSKAPEARTPQSS